MTGKNMPHSTRGLLFLRSFALLGLLLVAAPAVAQLNDSFALPGLNGQEAADTEPAVVASATAVVDPSTRQGTLRITAKIKSGWHIYSVTQGSGGPVTTVIKLDVKADAELSGKPKAVTKPSSHNESAFDNILVETHEDQAIWEVPIQLKPGIDPQAAKITGAVFAQACASACLQPTNYPFQAKITVKAVSGIPAVASSVAKPTGIAGDFRLPKLHVTVRGYLEPGLVSAGTNVNLVIEADPDKGYYTYGLADRPASPLGARPTLIVFSETSSLRFTRPVADVQPVRKQVDGAPSEEIHSSKVRWTTQLEVPKSAKPGEYPISGLIGIQTCKSTGCDMPHGMRFQGTLIVQDGPVTNNPNKVSLSFSEAKYAEAEQIAVGKPPTAPTDRSEMPVAPTSRKPAYVIHTPGSGNSTLPVMIVFALLGGLILNLMPCVLPVIGLKILGFAQQAGHDRRKILMLNLWYTAGLLAVFLVLATLASAAKLGLADQDLGWGQQFSSTAFNVVMASIVFVMALSFLGVWEIPIPGFVGSGKAQTLASQEGASGAFVKGIVTTLLATPCSGPFLGPVFGFTLTQSPAVIYVIFTAIGIGMAIPYLLIGAFPTLIAWLPKPGAWMDTFKQIMGFVMLGTVAFIFSFMQKEFVVPTFVLLIALWAMCWWIGRTPTYEPVGKQLRAWIQGGVFAAILGWFAFTQLIPGKEVLPWKPFDRIELARLQSEGKTVLVDFSADWCPTCKLNLKFAINTPAVAAAVDKNGVVPMLADWTTGSDEVTDMLADLKSKSIPILALFPANRPGEVIVLKDVVTKSQVLSAIAEAGPSRDIEAVAAAPREGR